jgi:hypothetical protein
MKKLSILLVALFLVPAVVHAYENDFMRMATPSGWSVQEMKMPGAGQVVGGTAARSASSRLGDIPVTSGGGAAASAAIGAGVGIATDTAAAGVGYGVTKSMMKGMPKFANATFTKGDAQIILMVVEGQGSGAAGAGAGSGGGSGKSNCETLENTSTGWGGSSAKLYSIACPQGNEWMYTTTVTMSKGGTLYTLIGTMPSKTRDDAAFDSTLKSARNTMLSSTSFK